MSIKDLTLILVFAFLVSVWVTGAVRSAASAAHFVDAPDSNRKKHTQAVPLLGGVAIFVSFFAVIFFLYFRGVLPVGYVHLRQIIALFAGGAILIFGGALDDRFNLRPSRQIIFPILAAGVAVLGGIHFTFIRNPFGGILPLDIWNLKFGFWNFLFPADILSFLWFLGIIYTTKLLDGLDGLVSGVAIIAAVLIGALALRPELNQQQTVVLAAALAAVLGGFLVWNFYPARIFLGEGGSTLVGFLVGGLAIAAGSKVATTLLVLGVPLFDVATVVARRILKRTPVSHGDRGHLHFRLLDAGFSHRRAVLLYYFLSIIFGGLSWFFGTAAKAVAFLILLLMFIIILFSVERKQISKNENKK